MKELQAAVASAVKDLYGLDAQVELTRPDEQFGDYSTNVALQLAAKLSKSPRQIAEAVAGKLQSAEIVAKTEVAGPGFINFFLSDKATLEGLSHQPAKTLAGQEILVEFGDPNPFKEMHIGHLYSYVVGDAIARLLEASGATVRRLSYHGDVGLHVAMAIWGMRQAGAGPGRTDPSLIAHIGVHYQKGSLAYEENQQVKAEIEAINEKIYAKDDEEINQLYDWAREESFREFDAVLDDLNIKTDKRYLESQAATAGAELVKKNLSSVFKESQGAVVYQGEKADLHTRVFITSKGLPTYEAKDLGLAKLKNQDFSQANRSIIITAHEQSDYFKVMLAALAEINKELAEKTVHLYHGFVNLSTGKMSSRQGEVYTAIKLMADVHAAAEKLYGANPQIEQAAIKYGFLKHRIGSNITYDPTESLSLEGNSGPYLQYAFVRAKSILQKAGSGQRVAGDKPTLPPTSYSLLPDERFLARKIGQYTEVVEQATTDLLPSHICTYLYELAQVFNRFYEKNRILGDERESLRLKLVEAYARVLKDGLKLLNIAAPEKM